MYNVHANFSIQSKHSYLKAKTEKDGERFKALKDKSVAF